MSCDRIVPEDQLKTALDRLEKYLDDGTVNVVIAADGAVAFRGWEDNDGVADVCAFRRLSIENSFALRSAISRAESLTGRKVNQHAVAAGHHSHDGGETWHGGH